MVRTTEAKTVKKEGGSIMKKLPEVNVVFEDLYRMLVTPIRSKLLLTGIERKVFNQLDIGRK